MTDKQIRTSMNFLAGWLDKASVGCLLVGMFQTNHMFGGFIGSMVCFLFEWAHRILEVSGILNSNRKNIPRRKPSSF